MTTRRRFLKGFGLSVLFPAVMLGEEQTQRRFRREWIANDAEPATPRHKPDPASWSNSTITAAWIGHATVLINFFGTWIITDPVFSDRIGLNVANLFTIGPRRLVHPALDFDELPPIDIVLVSHAHMDHLDPPSLRRFGRRTPLVMAKNTADIVDELGFETVYELDWGQWTRVADVRIDALEVKHFGWRYPWERDRSKGYHSGRSYNAYLVTKNGHSILFGGDTAYHEMFKQVKMRAQRLDLAIMPIGAYDPWIHAHANPEQALEMAEHAGASVIFPIHWCTFSQSHEPTMEPIKRLRQAVGYQPERIAVSTIGQTWSLVQPSAEGSIHQRHE